MRFERARFVIKGLLIAGITLCVLALIVQSGSPVLGFYLTMGGLICVVLCLFFTFTCMKCPFCGKRIIRNALVVKVCPHCRRDLVSGTKVKNKKIK